MTDTNPITKNPIIHGIFAGLVFTGPACVFTGGMAEMANKPFASLIREIGFGIPVILLFLAGFWSIHNLVGLAVNRYADRLADKT